MSEELEELETRFRNVARGRDAFVRFEPKDFILALDYEVAFQAETNTFEINLRRGGCFEGAYRCIERWIEAKSDEVDGIDSVPTDYVDLRKEMQYWLIEKIYEQFRSDVESAISEKASWLERVRPGDGVFGEVVVETRMRALVGLLAHLKHADNEVKRGIVSPETIRLWKNIGLDVFTSSVS